MSHPLFGLLQQLEDARIHFHLGRHSPDSILIAVTVPGERIEVNVFEDGHMEVSRFKGSEAIEGGLELLMAMISEHRD
jgi:hypothetical protein